MKQIMPHLSSELWDLKAINMVTNGGNQRFYGYMKQYNLESESNFAKKYGSTIANCYKDWLYHNVFGGGSLTDNF